jgi:hypothetical protein
MKRGIEGRSSSIRKDLKLLTVVLDIETIPDAAAAGRAGVDVTQVFPPWPLHELACVSLLSVTRQADWSVHFHVQTFSRAELSEGAIIAEVERSIADAFEVISYNGRSFDIPVLMARAAVARESCPSIAKLMAQSRRAVSTHVDLLEEVTAYGAASRVKLADFCAAFEIPVKIDAHGSDVESLAAQGAWEKVAHYCETDVVATWLALQFWRAVERDDPGAGDRAWEQLAVWIRERQPELAHLLPYAEPLLPSRGGRALSQRHLAAIRY